MLISYQIYLSILEPLIQVYTYIIILLADIQFLNMSFLQKEKVKNLSNFPPLTQRPSIINSIAVIPKMHDQPNNSIKKQISILPKSSRNHLRGSLSHGQLEKQFKFLNQNSLIMHRTNLNTLKHTRNTKIINTTKFSLQKFKQKQVKLDKDKKQEWFTLHKRVIMNSDKYHDFEERKVYKSRAKFRDQSKQIFSVKQVNSACYKGIFPNSRLNAAIIPLLDKIQLNYRIFLIGGQSPEMNTKFHFHQYDLSNQTWKPIQSNSPYPPQFNLSQHVLLAYQKTIFIIGGIAVFTSSTEKKNQRYNIPFISCFNLKTNSWSRINWNIYLRAHAASSFNNYGIIDGGIMQDNKNSGKTYLFDMAKSQQPLLVNSNSLKLSHHKIISTEAFQDKGKTNIKFQGLISFGGKKQDGSLNQNTYYMGFDSKANDFIEKFGKFQWSILETKGKSPPARYMHSMNLLQTKTNIFQRKVYCSVLGGIGESENILNDFWLLDLLTLQWTQVNFAENNCLNKGIAGHCSLALKNQILVFGGYNQSREHISKCWTITCENGIKIDKKMYKVRKQQQ